jgi:hypothetical protein
MSAEEDCEKSRERGAATMHVGSVTGTQVSIEHRENCQRRGWVTCSSIPCANVPSPRQNIFSGSTIANLPADAVPIPRSGCPKTGIQLVFRLDMRAYVAASSAPGEKS